ncbi:MAG: NUDIX hydrolase [Chloroflexi bacterium]|nr:NUDIX hydrolase [Chloroflexota bacterium]
MSPSHSEEPTIESRRIYSGKIIGVRVDTVTLPHGGTSQREIVEHGESVVAVPVDSQQRVLLVRQYRKAPEIALLEAPAGGLEEGESPEEGVRRELQEEIGLKPGTLHHIGGFWMTPGFCTEYMHAYIATDLQESDLPSDEDENIEVVPVPLSQVESLIRSGEIEDAKSIAVLLMAIHIYNDSL